VFLDSSGDGSPSQRKARNAGEKTRGGRMRSSSTDKNAPA
jgi:hypothetical protein